MRAPSKACESSAREHARANDPNIRPYVAPPFAPPLHLHSSLERSLPACPCAADDAIVIDCMVKGVIPPDCKSERFVSRAAHLLAPGGVITQWTWKEDYQLLSDRWRANFSKVTAQPYPGRALGGPGVLFVTNIL